MMRTRRAAGGRRKPTYVRDLGADGSSCQGRLVCVHWIMCMLAETQQDYHIYHQFNTFFLHYQVYAFFV